jgi:glutamyl-tRNA reductase
MQIWAAEIFTGNLPAESLKRLYSLDSKPVFGNKRRGFDELFILNTDSQFVVYGVGESIDPLLNFFLQDPSVYEHIHFYKSTEASINHLFATATGLCSEIKNARKALGQIQDAHTSALKSGGVGLILDNLIRQSLRVSDKVRTATHMDRLSSILVDSGMEIVFNQMESPSELTYLVIGTGDVARCAIEFFFHEGFRNVIIAAENEGEAKQLADLYSINVIEPDQLETFVQLSDVVITEDPVLASISTPFIEEVNYRQRKIVLDFCNGFSGNAELKNHPYLKLYNIEDINSFPGTGANVFHSLEEAWKMVETETTMALSALREFQHVPVLRACWKEVVRKGQQEVSMLRNAASSKNNHSLIRFFNDRLMKREISSHPRPISGDSLSSNPFDVILNKDCAINLSHTHLVRSN